MDTYTKGIGNYYGAISLDKNSMVNSPSSSLAVYLKFCCTSRGKRLPLLPFSFHPNAFYNPFVFQLCFAYKGILKDEIGLKFKYVTTNGQTLTQTTKVNTFFTKGDK